MKKIQVNFPEFTSYIRERNLNPPACTGGVKQNAFFSQRETVPKKKNETQNRTLLENRVRINQQ